MYTYIIMYICIIYYIYIIYIYCVYAICFQTTNSHRFQWLPPARERVSPQPQTLAHLGPFARGVVELVIL